MVLCSTPENSMRTTIALDCDLLRTETPKSFGKRKQLCFYPSFCGCRNGASANLCFGAALLDQRLDIFDRPQDQALMACKLLSGAYSDSPLGAHPEAGDGDSVNHWTALLLAGALLERLA